MTREREHLVVDVVIVGAGPAGLSAALRLGQLLQEHGANPAGGEPTILLIEKGLQVGSHLRSGAIIDPLAFQEWMPDFFQRAPVEQPVGPEEFLYLTGNRALRIPAWLIPRTYRNHGNYIVSISKLARWMAEEAERRGIMILTETSVIEPLIEDGRVVGVVTGPKGLDKQGQPKSNYDPGADVRARLVILAEGAHGTVADRVIQQFDLDRDRQPMIYSAAVKEVIEVPEKTYPRGKVMTTLGWPAPEGTFGGAFFYDMSGPYVAVGLVYGSDWVDPEMDLHLELQRWKSHPYIAAHLKNGQVVQYSACIIPESGFWSIPRLHAPGVLLTGDSAGLVNVPRNKGIHLAVKSGVLAAETAFACLQADDFSVERLAEYEDRLRSSWAWKELYRVRNFRQAFQDGLLTGALRVALYQLTGGRLLRDPLPVRAGHRLAQYGSTAPRDPVRFDGRLLLDKPTATARGAPQYDDQPAHVSIVDAQVCIDCQRLYHSPCTKFCPAEVFTWEADAQRILVSYENCLHPKICIIACPYDNIRWKPPQGGDGPRLTLT